MIGKTIAILALVALCLYIAHTILTTQPPRPQEFVEFGDYYTK